MEYYFFENPFPSVEISHYQLSDFLGWDGTTDPQDLLSGKTDAELIGLFYAINPYTDTETKVVGQFLRQYLLINRFFSFAYWTTSDDELTSEKMKWKTRVASAITKTAGKYLPIIQAYNTYITKLTDRVGSSSESHNRYNDTPQGEQSGSEWQGNEYVTNYTNNQSKAESDVNTPAQRLKEIQDSVRNSFASWLDEMNGCFYELPGR